MKLSILFSAFLVIAFFTGTQAQNYGLDNTDPSVFTNYKIPGTDLRSLWFNTNLYFNTDKYTFSDPASMNYRSRSDYNSNFRYFLYPGYTILKESDDMYLLFSGSLDGSYAHEYSEYQTIVIDTKNTVKSNMYTGRINLHFNYKNYINSENLFYSTDSRVNVSIDDQKKEEFFRSTTSTYRGSKLQDYRISLGAGIGKIRDITPVVSAVRFQERLKQVNMLNSNLSNKTIEDIAEQFSRQNYYSTVYNRPEKYFWRDVDKILAADGVSLDNLNMYSNAYLRETFNEVRFQRNEGFTSGLNLVFQYQNNYSSSGGIKTLQEMFFTLGEAYIIYSHQLSLNSQVNFDITISGGPNVIANANERQKYELSSSAGYDYELTDRLVASLMNSFVLRFNNYTLQEKYLTNSFTFGVRYFMEDNLSFDSNYEWDYQVEKYNNNNISIIQSTNNSHSVSLGFTYYFDRGIIIK